MLSIIIINYNTFKLTCDCINSIIDKTSCIYEIILVDNASIECKPEKFKSLFPFIKLIKSNINLGFSKGNNLGIVNASGSHILLLNSDTYLINNAIDLAFEKIKSDSKIGALSAQLIGVNGETQQASYQVTSIGKLIACSIKLHLIFKSFNPNKKDLHSEHFTEGLWGTFFMFPKYALSVFPENKLTETFFMYHEDAEWSHILLKAGYKLLYYPSAKIFHYGEASSSKLTNVKQNFNSLANQYHLFYVTRGRLYASFYFFALAIFYTSSFKKHLLADAKTIFSIGIKNLLIYPKPIIL